jgi:hypothetical protein
VIHAPLLVFVAWPGVPGFDDVAVLVHQIAFERVAGAIHASLGRRSATIRYAALYALPVSLLRPWFGPYASSLAASLPGYSFGVTMKITPNAERRSIDPGVASDFGAPHSGRDGRDRSILRSLT